MAWRKATKGMKLKPEMTCNVRDGLTVAQAKRYWNRPGSRAQTTSRERITKLGTEWKRSGRQVVMHDFDGDRYTFKCKGSRITSYFDYAEDLPRRRRKPKR